MFCMCGGQDKFRNTRADPLRMELIRLSGPVGQGGRNAPEDVMRVQRALNLVPLRSGGPGQPLVVDGKCGPKTVQAIMQFQRLQFRGAILDGRIDADKRTITRLSNLGGVLNTQSVGERVGDVSGGGASFPTQEQMDLAHSLVPDAERRVIGALARLAATQVALAKSQRTAQEEKLVREANWHFKAHLSVAPAGHLTIVSRVYTVMMIALQEHKLLLRDLFQPGIRRADRALAYAAYGGFFAVERGDRFIYITPDFQNAEGIIIHELAHLSGGKQGSGLEIKHRARIGKGPPGTKDDDGSSDYAGMSAAEGLTNAFSFAAFCFPDRFFFNPPQ